MADTKPKPALARRDLLLSAEKAEWLAGLLWRMGQTDDPSRLDDMDQILKWCRETRKTVRKGSPKEVRADARRALAAIRQYRKWLTPSWLHRDLLDSLEATLTQVTQ